MLNSISFNVHPDDPAIETVLGDAGVLVCGDDDGNFYVPSFGVNQIGDLGLEGYDCFITGGSDVAVTVEGMAIEQTTEMTIEAFKMNILPYLQ